MSTKRFRIIATAFDRKGRVIGAGVNSYTKTHPLMKLYAQRAGESDAKICKHAELSAILDAGNKPIHSLLVQRFDANGYPALAKPCLTCQCLIKDFGIRFVQYTSEEGIKVWDTKEI